MRYRDIEFAVIQEGGRDAWRWTVDLDESTAEAGKRDSQEDALTSVMLKIDRWFERKQLAGGGTKENSRCVIRI